MWQDSGRLSSVHCKPLGLEDTPRGKREVVESAPEKLLKFFDHSEEFGDYLRKLEQQSQVCIVKSLLWEPSGNRVSVV